MLTSQYLLIVTLSVTSAISVERDSNSLSTISKRSIVPLKNCTSENEGESIYHIKESLVIWICKSSEWTLFMLSSPNGKKKALSAKNCKEAKEALLAYCTKPPESGVYWAQNIQVYCDMEFDGGGWTLVWQHTYMKYKPLSPNMFYFSNYHQPCIKHAKYQEWCNIPNKARFNPTEQMTVAYHKGTIVYAYKGFFNRNIDYHWTGAILLDAKKVVDKCARSKNYGKPPSPSIQGNSGIHGLGFDKETPTDYYNNCDTYGSGTTLENPTDCRWADCGLPSSISSKSSGTDMTIAIYVR